MKNMVLKIWFLTYFHTFRLDYVLLGFSRVWIMSMKIVSKVYPVTRCKNCALLVQIFLIFRLTASNSVNLNNTGTAHQVSEQNYYIQRRNPGFRIYNLNYQLQIKLPFYWSILYLVRKLSHAFWNTIDYSRGIFNFFQEIIC